jgi:hypothetical protein
MIRINVGPREVGKAGRQSGGSTLTLGRRDVSFPRVYMSRLLILSHGPVWQRLEFRLDHF